LVVVMVVQVPVDDVMMVRVMTMLALSLSMS
jgi:hypothetical protein